MSICYRTLLVQSVGMKRIERALNSEGVEDWDEFEVPFDGSRLTVGEVKGLKEDGIGIKVSFGPGLPLITAVGVRRPSTPDMNPSV